MKKPALSRDSNIELLRILLMMMIVFHHFIQHGARLTDMATNSLVPSALTPYYLFFNSFLVIAVNCFVLISGFYGIRFKSISAISLGLQAFFYSLFLFCVSDLINFHTIRLTSMAESLFPVLKGTWWFITVYFFLYLLSPALNLVKENLNKSQFLYLLTVLTIINSIAGFAFHPFYLGVENGYSLMSFIYIYLLGQFLSEYPRFDIKKSLLVYIICSLLLFVSVYSSMLFIKQGIAFRLFSYNNPLVVFASVSFFQFFRKLSIKSRFINYISGAVLAVYIIQEHPRVGSVLYPKIYSLSTSQPVVSYFFILVALGIAIFATGIAVEKVRAALFRPVINFIYQRLRLGSLDETINSKTLTTTPYKEGN